MADFEMKTVKKLGVIRQNDKSSVELRITEVNGKEAFDIRPWYEKDGEEKCGKGIRLTEEEMNTLAEIISTMDESQTVLGAR